MHQNTSTCIEKTSKHFKIHRNISNALKRIGNILKYIKMKKQRGVRQYDTQKAMKSKQRHEKQ